MKNYFKTSFGTFYISSAPYGGYNLVINDDVINWSEKAEDLALQVYEKTSGFEEWDKSELEAPKNLEEWQVKI
ncbi:MAG: hypothetical protein C0625_11715 [Arcobacter sp.]|nr:MAG: hypothetical protein C0625_11715 [Arcobacter sp.]